MTAKKISLQKILGNSQVRNCRLDLLSTHVLTSLSKDSRDVDGSGSRKYILSTTTGILDQVSLYWKSGSPWRVCPVSLMEPWRVRWRGGQAL